MCEALLRACPFVLPTLPASTGMGGLPRTVPGAAGMPGGSRWKLLWRPVFYSGQLPVGPLPVPGR
jgi:hypothetical protein